ncbi:MAG: hypothetical protein IKO55_14110, partial [Kiritimatiellae bacterium]|nr:hypothetical protein [Kiritimatiellia bacterium]
MTHPVLLVGVGGAGLNTLAAFNRNLASNPAMRPRMADELYYLAVDTERYMLDHFMISVAQDAGTSPRPYVRPVHLSHGFDSLDDLVHLTFDRQINNRVGFERLCEHWWVNADGKPFSRDIHSLNYGSGAYPQEGYGLAWYQLIKLESDITDIIERIIPQIADGQLPNVDVFVVASLVGGTGRGAWAPIALKIKEVFKHCWNMNVRSTGILFDAGVFESVFQEIPPCERTLRVNSLTGLSELSAWLPPDGPGLSVDLPNMMRPDPKRRTDVLRTSIDAGAHAVNPVDTVYLVCGRIRDAFLDNPLQYEEMAGTALAAMLVHPIVRASRINQPDRYNSFAACQFAVDARGLNLYFNYLARTMAIDEFLSSDGDVEGVVDEYLRRFPMTDAVRSVQDVQPLDNGTLLQRAALSLLALPRLQGDLKDLRERLLAARRGDVERIRKQVFLFVESVSDAEIQMAVKAAVASGLTNRDGRISDPRAELESAFREASRANGGIPRFGFVRRFAERLLARIRETDESSLEEIRLPNQDGTILLLPEEWIDEEVRAFAQMTLADLLSHRGLFSDAEINQLDSPEQPCFEGDVPTAVVSAAYPRLRA